MTDPRLIELTRDIRLADRLAGEAILVVRSTRRGRSKTLRQAMEAALRQHFDFDLLYCPVCRTFQDPLNYHRDSAKRSGRCAYCIPCSKLRRAPKPERTIPYAAQDRQARSETLCRGPLPAPQAVPAAPRDRRIPASRSGRGRRRLQTA